MENNLPSNELPQEGRPGVHPHPINIVVEVNGRNKHVRLDFFHLSRAGRSARSPEFP